MSQRRFQELKHLWREAPHESRRGAFWPKAPTQTTMKPNQHFARPKTKAKGGHDVPSLSHIPAWATASESLFEKSKKLKKSRKRLYFWRSLSQYAGDAIYD